MELVYLRFIGTPCKSGLEQFRIYKVKLLKRVGKVFIQTRCLEEAHVVEVNKKKLSPNKFEHTETF